jgi:SNF2 family DNA or RNA helicase
MPRRVTRSFAKKNEIGQKKRIDKGLDNESVVNSYNESVVTSSGSEFDDDEDTEDSVSSFGNDEEDQFEIELISRKSIPQSNYQSSSNSNSNSNSNHPNLNPTKNSNSSDSNLGISSNPKSKETSVVQAVNDSATKYQEFKAKRRKIAEEKRKIAEEKIQKCCSDKMEKDDDDKGELDASHSGAKATGSEELDPNQQITDQSTDQIGPIQSSSSTLIVAAQSTSGRSKKPKVPKIDFNTIHPDLENIWTDLKGKPKPDLLDQTQPPRMTVTLLPFQREGLKWMLLQERESEYKGGILADEMGLGKTIQMYVF